MKAFLSFFDFLAIFSCLFFLFIFALTFHKCQFAKKAFLFILIFGLFFKWGLFCVFFWVSVPVFFGVFYGVRAGLRNLFFLLCFSCPFLVLGAGRRAAFFSVWLLGCVLVFFFFVKAILSFFDFLAIF